MASSCRILGTCTILAGCSTNGVKMTGTIPTLVRQLMAVRGSIHRELWNALGVAAAGTVSVVPELQLIAQAASRTFRGYKRHWVACCQVTVSFRKLYREIMPWNARRTHWTPYDRASGRPRTCPEPEPRNSRTALTTRLDSALSCDDPAYRLKCPQ